MSGTNNADSKDQKDLISERELAEFTNPAPVNTPNQLRGRNGDDDWNGSWREWARHVLMELKRLNDNYDDIDTRITASADKYQRDLAETRTEFSSKVSLVKDAMSSEIQKINIAIAMLNVKAGIWGAIGAAVIALSTLITFLATEYIKK